MTEQSSHRKAIRSDDRGKTTLVLLGIGHAHLHVLREWRRRPLPNARLICLNNFGDSAYSGMLPGVLAGMYEPRQMKIDLASACRVAGAELIVGQVAAVDLPRRTLQLDSGQLVPFDLLSINVGSVPKQDEMQCDDRVVPIKPMQTFVERMRAAMSDWRERQSSSEFHLTIVGGGAGGTELAFCLPNFVQRELRVEPNQLRTTLVHGHDQLGAGTRESTRQLAERLLRSRGVDLRLGQHAERIEQGRLMLSTGQTLAADLIVWATGAASPPLLGRFDLPRDDHGFLLTDRTLRSVSGSPIFAVGDCGSIEDRDPPKAGVYAVRQGPVLWENLSRLAAGNQKLREYEPQGDFLKLFNTGDGRALMEYRWLTRHARWCWWLKDWIDRRFVARHQAS
ncbi:MAG: FAD-dependent oxidoreductase [Planctomycetales bacterium]|nr:FAD-dependent oxidoreductase [Planctomycetales bacterium]